MEGSLKDKTVKGVGWSAIDNVAKMGVSFVISIILARLIDPDSYGLLGLVAIFTAVCNSIINGGFGSALIRQKECTDQDYSTAFVINLGLSLLLYAVIFICAPYIAIYFNRQELVLLVRVSSVSMIIGAFSLVQQTRLTKIIDFKTQTKITIISSVISGVIGIVMAFLGYGVWALVAQNISSQLFRTLFLVLYNKWMPSLRFYKDSFRNLFGFGWKIMVSSIIDTTWTELYQVVVGKYYNPATLGQYTRAKGFSQLLSMNLTGVIQRVTYPVLSNIQDDKTRMVSAYRQIIKITMFISFLGLFSLGAVSEPLLYCLIGPKWHEAATYLPYICFVGSLYPLHAINLNMLQVQGRSDLFLGLEIVKKIIGLAPLFIGAFIGIFEMLIAIIITSFINYFLNSYFPGKLLGYSSWMQIRDIAPSFALTMSLAIMLFLFKYLPVSYWFVLPIQIIVGIVFLYFVFRYSKLPEIIETKNIAFQMLRKIKSK